MDDNLIAQAAIFVWRILGDFWEIYQTPLYWLWPSDNVPLIIWAGYVFFTLTALAWSYIWIYLASGFPIRKQRRLTAAIDESFTPDERSFSGLVHSATGDYRLQYLNLLREISKKQDVIHKELTAIRLQKQGED
jgi:hypothetical protein